MNLRTLLLVSLLFILGCNSSHLSEDPKNWSEDQVSQWFNQKAWLGKTELQPDSSINKREFAIRYHQNKERWNMAFSFLKDANLAALEIGNHELDGKNVFVKVTEYNSKDAENAFYESHKNYTDIHYVVSGSEYIEYGGRLPNNASIKVPYDKKKDISFYTVGEGKDLIAKPGTFFIFFPGELHKPGIKIKESTLVKKIVIKVRN